MEFIIGIALCVIIMGVASWCSKPSANNPETQGILQHKGLIRSVLALLVFVVAIAGSWYGSQSWMYQQMKQCLEAGDYAGVHARYHSRWWQQGRWEPSYWDAYSEWKLACENTPTLSTKKLNGAVDLMMQYMWSPDGEPLDADTEGYDATVVAITRELDGVCRPAYEEGLRLLESGSYEDAITMLNTVNRHYRNVTYWLDVARYMREYESRVKRNPDKAITNFTDLQKKYQPALSAREKEVLYCCREVLDNEAFAVKLAETRRKLEAEQRRKEELRAAIRKNYPSLSQQDMKDCEDIMKYPHKGMPESQVQDTPFGRGYKWNVGRSSKGNDVDCYTFKKDGQTICYAYVESGIVKEVAIFHEDVCDFFPWHAEDILNLERDPYDLRNELNNNPIFIKNKQKNGSTSGSSSSNKGSSGSSSGSKSHGFVGSEDEWEDYDDYMDDYEYWEHRDVDDEDDWEDDWDED